MEGGMDGGREGVGGCQVREGGTRHRVPDLYSVCARFSGFTYDL